MKKLFLTFFVSIFFQFSFSQNIVVTTSCPSFDNASGIYYPYPSYTINGKPVYSNYIKHCLEKDTRNDCNAPIYEIMWDGNKWVWSKVERCRWVALDYTCRTRDEPITTIIATSTNSGSTPVGITNWVGTCIPIIKWEIERASFNTPCPDEYTDATQIYDAKYNFTNGKINFATRSCVFNENVTDCNKRSYEIEWNGNQWLWNNLGERCYWSVFDDTCRTKIFDSSNPEPPKIIIAKSSDAKDMPLEITDWVCTYEVLSVSDINLKNNISYYPNPSNGIFNLNFKKPQSSIEITIVNEVGQIVKTQTYSNKENVQLDLKKQNDGVYIVKIVTEDKKEAVIKLIKSQK